MFQAPGRADTLPGQKDEKPKDAPTAAAGRFQIGPPIEKLLAIPSGLDGLTPLQAADCFLKSEEFYVERALRVASEMETRLRFHIKLNKIVLFEAEIAPLFINLQQIYAFNKKLYAELLKLRLHGDLVAGVGHCMMLHIPFFKLYAGYIKEYRKAQAFCDILVEKKKKFLAWLDLNELCAGYSLKTLLLAPVTRMPQYLIFLGAIVRSLDPESVAAGKILEAITAVAKVSDDIAFGLKDEVSRKLVVTIQAKIFGNNCNLISPSRFVVKHSDLRKMYNKSLFGGSSKIYLFILFNDCLIYGTRPGKLSSGSIKHVLPLCGMSIEEERDDEKKKIKNGFKINSNTKSFVCCAINGPTKQSWVKALRDQIQIANASASTLQKGQQAADVFEKTLKNKASRDDSQSAASAAPVRSPHANNSISQSSTNRPIGVPSTPSGASFSQPFSAGGGSIANTPSASFSHTSHASFSQAAPPPPSSSAYSAPPPPAPAPGPPRPPPSFMPALSAPMAPGPPPPPSSYGAPPPAPPQSSYRAPPPPPIGYTSGGYGQDVGYGEEQQQQQEEAYDQYPPQDNFIPPDAPVLEYDIPVVSPTAPPPPPMAPSAPSFTAAPKVDLLSQIQAGKALRSTEPQWVQILDASSGAYYYEHKQTGESTWEAPDSFVPAAGAGQTGATKSSLPGVGNQAMEDKLKSTLDRYRQFVQDEEDDVAECGDDEWD